jgi:thioredoxin
MSSVKVSGDSTFTADIPAEGVAVVDFWADWCGPCRAFAPVFEASASQKPTVTHLKVNVDESPNLSGQYEIRSIPTTMFLRDGIVVGRIAGALTASRLADLIKQTEDLDMNKIKGNVKP